MEYIKLANILDKLESEDSYLEKTKIISDFLHEITDKEIEDIILLLQGEVYASFEKKELGIGIELIKKSIATSTGYNLDDVKKKFKKVGDLGKLTKEFLSKKKQSTLFSGVLTVKKVLKNIRKLPEIVGEKSQDRKLNLISELLTIAKPIEGKYIIRTILGDLRIGIGHGRLKEALAKTFELDEELIDRALMLTNDFPYVCKVAIKEGEEGLKNLKIKINRPINPMLAQSSENLDDIMSRMETAAYEIKLDGMRIQAHKSNSGIKLFTRRFDDITEAFPEIVEAIESEIDEKNFIIDGELVAYNTETKKPLPFQKVLRRRRKYHIDEYSLEIPLKLHLFDIMYLNDEMLIDHNYEKRRSTLESIIKKSDKIKLVTQIISSSKSEIMNFLKDAIKMGHEGLLAKSLDSTYRAGKREFLWMKLKPTTESIDTAVVGAYYGRGRRSGSFGSYLLAIKDDDHFKTISRLGAGLKDTDLEELTEILKDYQTQEKNEKIISYIEPDVWFRPKIVFEIIYEEIQASPKEKHSAGFGLRFPRFVKIREDKSEKDINSLDDIKRLYQQQKE